MGWNDTTPKDKPTCSMSSLELKTETCLPVSEICSDGIDSDKQYALSSNGGTTVIEEITPTDLTEVNDAIAANAAAIAGLVDKTLNTVYTGTTNDKPADGLVTLNFNIVDQDGNVESTYTVDVPDSTELPDVNTTYVFNPTPNGGFSAQPVDESGNPIGVPFLLGSDDQTANEVSIVDAGDYFVASDVEGALQELGADCADKEARIAALEGINPVVDTEVIAGSSDIIVTYLDGTTETLDLPEFAATTEADGTVTFDLNGTPFGPFDPAPDEDTFSTAVDNGDGTTTVTYADGSTATFATGPHEVDTNTTYSFVTNPNGSIRITGSDGSVFTGPPATVDTDTDTFATLSGQTITFADGSTLTVPVANESTMSRNSDGSITHTSDTGTTFDINVDGTKTTSATLTTTDYGLSRNVNKPVNMATTLADVNDPLAATGDVTYQSMQQLFTNRAVEAGAGMMNVDGSVGHYAFIAPDLPTALQNNGASVNIPVVDATTVAVPAPEYNGQRLYINWTGANTFDEMEVTTPVNSGRLRSANRSINPFNVSGAPSIVRSGESWMLTGVDGRWKIQSTLRFFFGVGWRENEDGTATLWGIQNPGAAVNTNVTVNLPVALSTTNYIVHMTPGASAPSTDTNFAKYMLTTPITGLAFDARNTGPRTLAFRWTVEGGRLDYAAL